jgi:hypothetical protein
MGSYSVPGCDIGHFNEVTFFWKLELLNCYPQVAINNEAFK